MATLRAIRSSRTTVRHACRLMNLIASDHSLASSKIVSVFAASKCNNFGDDLAAFSCFARPILLGTWRRTIISSRNGAATPDFVRDCVVSPESSTYALEDIGTGAGEATFLNSIFYRYISQSCSSLPPGLHMCRTAGFSEQRRWYASVASENSPTEAGSKKETISVTFVDKDGNEKTIGVPLGMSMLEAAHENDIELEGACEGSLACSTCHVIVMDERLYEKIPEPSDEENDMLDLAFGLTQTSRLGCQVVAQRELDGLRLALPSATRNFAVDGFVPKPH